MESGESGRHPAGQARSSWLDMPPLIKKSPFTGRSEVPCAAVYGQTASGASMVEAGLTIAVIAGLYKGAGWPAFVSNPTSQY